MSAHSRRSLLGIGASLGVAAWLPHGARAAAAPSLDLDDPATHLKTYQRIRTNGSGKPQLWYALGTIYGKLPGEKPRPLMYGEGVSYTRQIFDPQTNRLKQTMTELGYYLDYKTRRPLDEWTNPYNGKTVKIRHYRVKQAQTVTVDKVSGGEEGRVAVEHDGYMAAPLVHSGRVWLTEVHTTEVYLTDETKPDKRGRKVNGGGSNATFSAALSDVLDRSQDAPAAQLFFSNMVGFMYWMEMGDSPGMMTWRALGNKLSGPDLLDASMRARIERDHPGWLAAPDV
jgi:hypothetical protein